MRSLINRVKRGADISLLHQSLPLVAIQLALIVGLSWYGYTQGGAGQEQAMSGARMPLERWINSLASLYPHLTGGIIVIIALLSSFVIVRVISRNLIFAERTYLPAILYFVLCYGLYYPLWELSAMVTSYLMAVAVATLIYALPKGESFGKSFKAALLIGITPLLHSELVIMLLFVPMAMILMKRGGGERVVAIVGALLPIATWAYIEWMRGGEFTALFVEMWRDVSSNGVGRAFMELTSSQMTLAITIGVAIILSMVLFFALRMKMRTLPHRVLRLIIVLQMVALVTTLFSQTLAAILPVVAIPLSFTLPLLFTKHQSVVTVLLYLMIAVGVVVSTLSLL